MLTTLLPARTPRDPRTSGARPLARPAARFAGIALALLGGLVAAPVPTRGDPAPAPPEASRALPPVATFSIVGYDPETEELGIAVQSKFVAVGAVVPWARAGVGAVATQAWANTRFGPVGLALLAAGKSPDEVADTLVAMDDRADHRQFGIVDARGRSVTVTGGECLDWAGGRNGPNFAAQGNILAGPAVVDAMADTFTSAEGDLGDRLLAALAAGQEAGGDRRGRQSAALLIVRQGWGYGGFNDRYRDLRVDDHPTPIAELQRLHTLHRSIFKPPSR